MAVTAAMVKELRDRSGAGMSACKEALTEANGDMERSIEILREKGLAAAAKKAGRVAAEGLVHVVVADNLKSAAIVEVNSETDFVAKNKDFIDYVVQVAELALKSDKTTVEDFLTEPWATGGTVQDALTQKIATIGENIGIRRFVRLNTTENGVIVKYIHGGGRVAVVLELESTVSNETLIEAGRNLCMQIAAMSPLFVARANVPEDYIAKEKEILIQQAINEGRPANIAEKVVEGRLTKNLVAICLLEQDYVKDDSMTCAKYLESIGKQIGSTVTVKNFIRYETGEGIEKKVEDFAEEVSKAMGN
ncbi:MAG: translation elongation factor Ts [Firmicutes bacterium]|nr:translation elongation factor Ts [Bacillota bacterium]